MLAPHISGGRLTLLLEHKPVAADIERDRVRGITVRDLRTGRDLTLRAPWFLDATETGGLLPLTRTEYVTGFESRSETGEAHAPAAAQPANVQAFTVCFAMDYDRGADHTIERPEEYVFWRDYVPKLTPPWTGKLLSWTGTHPVTLQPRTLPFDPTQDTAQPGQPLNLWLYRRIARAKHFEPETFLSDISLVNWPQNDYWLGRIDDVPEAEAARHVRRAKQLSLSLLYWMQTDGGWKGLRLRRDVAGTADGLAKAPYVRESRRIRAEFTVLEQHVTAPGQRFSDPVGVGSYRIDLHPSTGGDNYIDIASQPFQIPLGSLIPRRVDNLIPACKNIGVTHITNGCYRLHPVEWNIGESAGMLAAFAQSQRTTPRAIRATPDLLESFQALLTAQGIQLSW
jgi:hypothetical protein